MKTILTFLLATAATIALHVFVGWQVSLIVPLAYAFLQPERAIVRTILQMVIVWLVLLLVSYGQAPDETVRMMTAVTGILTRSQALPGGTLAILSLLFAELLGLLCAWAGSSARRLSGWNADV
jgi:hypothetical protein